MAAARFFLFFFFSFDRSYVDRPVREIETVRIFPNLYSKASAVARRDTDSPPIQYLSRHVPSSNNCYPSDTFVRVDAAQNWPHCFNVRGLTCKGVVQKFWIEGWIEVLERDPLSFFFLFFFKSPSKFWEYTKDGKGVWKYSFYSIFASFATLSHLLSR